MNYILWIVVASVNGACVLPKDSKSLIEWLSAKERHIEIKSSKDSLVLTGSRIGIEGGSVLLATSGQDKPNPKVVGDSQCFDIKINKAGLEAK